MTEPLRPDARPGRPVLMVVEHDALPDRRIGDQLRRRYGADYDVVDVGSSADGLARLRSLREWDAQVALVLCDRGPAGAWPRDLASASSAPPDSADEDFFGQVRTLYPDAKRALVVNWGAWADRATADSIHQLVARGEIDYYTLRPWRSPDEFFHRTVTEFLLEWERAVSAAPREVTVVGERWSARAHELRSLLVRNGVPHTFHANDTPAGRAALRTAGLPATTAEPVVLLRDGRVLVDPTNARVADAYGVSTSLGDDTDFDVIVVGAGPAGLAAAVYASSEGLRTLVVEREAIGGQAGSSSLIRNYLGFARGITGADLAQRAYQQAWVFGTTFLLMRELVSLDTQGGWHIVTANDGERARARALVLATGVSYRRIGVPALEALEGAGVFYGASVAEARALSGEDVFVVGGGNSAGQAAMHLSRYARSVTLLVRGTSLAQSMSQYLIDSIDAAGIRVRLEAEVVDGGGDGRLTWIGLRDRRTGETRHEPAGGLFVLIGAQPHTDWLPERIERDQWGYLFTGPDVMESHAAHRWPLERQPLMLETCVPGVFAVGDVRRRSVKRVASAVGEGSVVIQQVHEVLSENHPAGERP
ncbi:FAD-dependent oxidoreductase [Jiangella gansuensis]|uniref:FAD-dependent oxidoreductase n=1 Tax=Jiangella gansuensis TaxID=281473 RepID=UPI0004B411E5|nr:FAD-dependent oxidoreductase [Jiangella gansuensis]